MDLSQAPIVGAGHSFPNERRASPRYLYQGKMLCQLCPWEPGLSPKAGGKQAGSVWFMGVSEELSATGIGFILHRRFDPGTLLTIELERPKRDSWGLLPARVMHVTAHADGNWKLGCALVKAMSQEELHGWIDNQSKLSALR